MALNNGGTITMNGLELRENDQTLDVLSDRFSIAFERNSGRISSATINDSVITREVMASGACMGWQIDHLPPVAHALTAKVDEDLVVVESKWHSGQFAGQEMYTITPAGVIICQSTLNCPKGTNVKQLRLGIRLHQKDMLGHQFQVKELGLDFSSSPDVNFRAMEISVGTEERPDVCAVNFLLEYPQKNFLSLKPQKLFSEDGEGFFGWEYGGNDLKLEDDFTFSNRWAVTLTGFDNCPNKVRGQRIYHWYGQHPVYPGNDILEEMAEYGCSILVLHSWTAYIEPYAALDEKELKRVIRKSRQLGIKVVGYLCPYLISHRSPMFSSLRCFRTADKPIWISRSDKCQVCFYKANQNYDSDELCLRCGPAFDYIKDLGVKMINDYKFDGLYLDFAWPAEYLCNNTAHEHEAGLFNFIDYWRLLRNWRQSIGPDAVMIAHGGGYLTAADMVEGVDGCLTGEAQADLDAFSVCQRCGKAPTLWTMHRRKFYLFRSYRTIAAMVREGVTPHVGVGVMGTSIVGTVDPAHWREVLALWQIWRAFPVQEALFYNYLTPPVLEISNDQIAWSLYAVPGKYALLVLAHAGPRDVKQIVPVRCQVKFDCAALRLPSGAKTIELRGSSYDNFRINDFEPLKDGKLLVGEVNLGEVAGILVYSDKLPSETLKLQKSLNGRFGRIAKIMSAKIRRLQKNDQQTQKFAHEPTADSSFDFTADRANKAAE